MRRTLSLRWRLFAGTLAALVAALLVAGVALHALFRDHVTQQFQRDLGAQLDLLTARLEVDAQGRPVLPAQALPDPRWQRPYSGLYWQIDRPPQAALLRSRSLWDTVLHLPADTLADGAVHLHTGRGPQGQPLLMQERSVRWEGGAPLRLIVAADSTPTLAAIAHFRGLLAGSLAVLALLLSGAAVAQVLVGLAPLRALGRALHAVRSGQTQQLEGRFPAEVQPLIDDFNGVLASRAELLARTRTQAGNLAHALKTPLAVLQQAAEAPSPDLPAVVREQVQRARRQVDAQLARARAAGTLGAPGQNAAVGPALQGLARVMRLVHAERGIVLSMPQTDARVALDLNDLHDLLGNLLDNACKWAHRTVRAEVVARGAQVRITLHDDGPGIAPAAREAVLGRGTRLDEATPGSGLGLAIVADLVALYGGTLRLGESPDGGLAAEVTLPAA